MGGRHAVRLIQGKTLKQKLQRKYHSYITRISESIN